MSRFREPYTRFRTAAEDDVSDEVEGLVEWVRYEPDFYNGRNLGRSLREELEFRLDNQIQDYIYDADNEEEQYELEEFYENNYSRILDLAEAELTGTGIWSSQEALPGLASRRQAEYEDVEVTCEEQAGQMSNPVTYGEVCGQPFYAYDYDGTALCQGHYDARAQRAEMGWAGGPYGDYQQ